MTHEAKSYAITLVLDGRQVLMKLRLFTTTDEIILRSVRFWDAKTERPLRKVDVGKLVDDAEKVEP